MADRDKGSDIDKLLAEVDGMLTGGTPAKGPVAPSSSAEPSRGGFAARCGPPLSPAPSRPSACGCVFAVLPFLAAPSGAVGAFLGTFAAVFIFRRRR